MLSGKIINKHRKTHKRTYPRLKIDFLIITVFIFGVLCLIFGSYLINTHIQPQPNSSNQISDNLPVRIVVPKVNINLPIVEAKIDAGTWQVATDSANHLNTSASPGQNNNIVIYGHNLDTLFGPLYGVKQGDLIKIYTQQGQKYDYLVTKTLTIKLNQIEYIASTSSEMLTVYTCNGFFDSQRFLIQATPSVEKKITI